MPDITNRTVLKLSPKSAPYFVRDTKVKGFAIKVNPTGTIKFIAETHHEGRSIRKTLGEYPLVQAVEARQLAINFLHQVRSGQLVKPRVSLSLQSLFERYTAGGRLKPNTLRNYKHVVQFYLSDWLKLPVASISRQMVEERFFRIRDKGMSGGKPTYSQATKTMRILSALMNFAMAEESIENNPVQILKLKRISRSIQKRENYLPAVKARELLEKSAQDPHPVTLGVHLMLFTGLRKNEALRLMWRDIEEVGGVKCLIIRDTKNNRPHFVPVTQEIEKVLRRAENASPFVFPSVLDKRRYVSDERSTIRRLSRLIQYEFRCHDLRRSFATRASEVGIDFLTVKRLLNHKSHDITAQYIQWASEKNLLGMREALDRVSY